MTTKFQKVLKSKFVCQTAGIYGGEKGLFDLLPCGSSLLKNIINQWDKFFVINEEMLSVECTMLTPAKVLIASGHVERFNDYMVKDVETGEFFRADHLIEKHLEELMGKGDGSVNKEEIDKIIKQIDNYGQIELTDLIKKFNIKSPDTNTLTDPTPFNLMFETNIGPGSKTKAYLRPETAQGIFINFNKLYQEKRGKLPFAAAQVGTSFRNEISPRSGLLRAREFKMAEIEHFLDPRDKTHKKFSKVRDLEIKMFNSCDQINGAEPKMMNLGEAVDRKIIDNETLGYFIGRIYMFLIKVGIKTDKIRFRQHMPNEMAHYACDCWDAEILTNQGWIECVGCADRSAYDLDCHTKFSGNKLIARRTLDEPKIVKLKYCKPVMGVMGKTFKQHAKMISSNILALSDEDKEEMVELISSNGTYNLVIDDAIFTITSDMVQIIEEDQKVYIEEFTPNVIEPSFGLGRILYCILEHNFDVRKDDEDRTFFTLPATIAPYKFAVLPLSSKKDLIEFAEDIIEKLKEYDILCNINTTSTSIGKRYSLADEEGIPFGITIDFDSIKLSPPSVTVRERDSMQQIRVNIDDLPFLAWQLSNEKISWNEACKKYPIFEGQIIGV